jgi:carbon monoxide dehydrogenase subunit G
MDLSAYRLRESITVDAPAEKVWARVSDITRMGDASPACTACEWDDAGAGMVDGAWFTGTNKAGDHSYQTRCQIDSCRPGTSFSFVNYGMGGDSASSRWGYEVAPDGDRTRLTETWELLPGMIEYVTANYPDVDVDALVEERKGFAANGIDATLAALKAELEG